MKSLLRFRCVCKRWSTLIDEPRFVKVHFSQYRNIIEGSHLLVVEYPMTLDIRMWTIRHGDMLVETDVHPRNLKFRFHLIRDYLHGVVLRTRAVYPAAASVVLLYASIQKYVVVPSFDVLLPLVGFWQFRLRPSHS